MVDRRGPKGGREALAAREKQRQIREYTRHNSALVRARGRCRRGRAVGAGVGVGGDCPGGVRLGARPPACLQTCPG